MCRFTLLFLLCCCFAYSQENNTIRGKVVNEKNIPLPNVSISIIELGIGTFTNKNGYFILKADKNTALEVSAMGFKTKKVYLNSFKDISKIVIILKEDLLNLSEVVVTAKRKYNSKEGTSVYKISNQAIKQIQAMNLGDALSLLPGNRITPPNLTKPKVANLRSAISSGVNSFGTAIFLDGMVLSNDANLQATNPSSSLRSGKSTVGSGFDLRNVSLANIESVEVISGIASPKYGNLSSGGIIVKSKVGASTWIVNSNISSTNYQASLAKGFQLPNWGVLNSDFSYAYSSGSPTERKLYYQNFNLGLRWKLPVFHHMDWNHFTSFRITHSDDGNRHEPDELYKSEQDIKSTMYQLGFSGNLSSVLGRMNYNFNGSVTNQYSYFKSYNRLGPFPITEALTNGTYHTVFTPPFFLTSKEIKGRPVNFNARLEILQYINTENIFLNFESGLQYLFSDNTGSGRISTGNISHPNWSIGSRSASFNKIPASKTFSAYHQTRIKHTYKEITNRLNLGIRYDNMIERYNLFSPRLSASSKYKNFNLRASWGISYKAPAMIQLHPGKTYIDYTNYMHYANNPKERLAVVTTYVQNPTNKHLKPNYVNLKEIGFDWDSSILNVHFTYFNKKLNKGIQHTDELLLLPNQKYRVVKTLPNKQPIVEPIPGQVINVARKIRKLKNNYYETTNGVELTINPKKIEATNTEFNFRYSYLKSLLNNTGYNIKSSKYTVGNNPVRFGVYHNNSLERIRSFGTLILIQHIPSLRFVLTLSAELNFKYYSSYIGPSIYPYAYYKITGDYINIPESERKSSKYKDLILNKREYTPSTKPFFSNFNLQVRKETKQGHSFSFFANNAPWYNPKYEEHGGRRQLNDKLSVGFSLSFLIK